MKKKLLLYIPMVVFSQTVQGQNAHLITMTSADKFSPANLTVNAGDLVVWRNDDTYNHTSTSGLYCTANGLWNSGVLVSGATFNRVFSKAGTFPFHCAMDCGYGMIGTITVQVVAGNRKQSASINDFKLFPNPVGTSEAYIELDLVRSSEVRIELADLLGKTIHSVLLEDQLPEGKSTVSFDVSGLSEGLYLCKIFLDGELSIIEKITK